MKSRGAALRFGDAFVNSFTRQVGDLFRDPSVGTECSCRDFHSRRAGALFRSRGTQGRSQSYGACGGWNGLPWRGILRPVFRMAESQPKEMRKLLDDLGIRCFLTHNDSSFFNRENLPKACALNLILGSKYVVVASAEPEPGVDGWKAVAETLNFAAEQFKSAGLKAGYHNHRLEFTPAANQPLKLRPIEIIAKNTKPTIMMQLDVGTCLEAGLDPVAWIRANPGRILHCIARIGHRTRRRHMRSCSARARRTGKTFSPPRKARAEWNSTWSNKKVAGFRNSIPPGSVSRSFALGIRNDRIYEHRWRLLWVETRFFSRTFGIPQDRVSAALRHCASPNRTSGQRGEFEYTEPNPAS